MTDTEARVQIDIDRAVNEVGFEEVLRMVARAVTKKEKP